MRILVYVNTNNTQKHITIHLEKKVCPYIFQNVSKNSSIIINPIQDVSEDIANEVIKIAETENSFWLLVHANSCEEVINSKVIQEISRSLKVPIQICKECSKN